ncbi:MAG: ATP-binding cassette domain-containing protein [Lachnospiraceae bacterium]|nr:ATP-binding cassette domain-containing protein [Lachnospiraceae bacterium]
MIEIRNLTKKYGNHIAVDDISLDIKPGKVYGFLGPNGAGKSTTMNIITGYLAPTSGEVKIDGHDIYKEPEEAKACIGYLPEIPPLYVDMKVEEYLEFVAELKKVSKDNIKKEVERVINLTRINDVSSRIINNLSKGYRQRVGMAQAIIGSPKIIILDEPTVGLDPNQIKEVRDLIKSLAGDHTVILSSHILSEISETCSHVFIINKGKIIANNSIETLSNYFNSKQVLEIVAKGDLNKCKEVIEKIEDIESVSVENGTEEGTINITVTAHYSKDVREDVSLALSSEKISIFEMKEDVKSLEDVFLQLTNEEGEE